MNIMDVEGGKNAGALDEHERVSITEKGQQDEDTKGYPHRLRNLLRKSELE